MESLNEKPKYIKITSEEGLKELEYIKYNNNYECKLCPISMTKFEENEEIIKLFVIIYLKKNQYYNG